MRQLWDNYETFIRQLWDNYETIMRQVWDKYVTTMRPIWDRCDECLTSVWQVSNKQEVAMRQVWTEIKRESAGPVVGKKGTFCSPNLKPSTGVWKRHPYEGNFRFIIFYIVSLCCFQKLGKWFDILECKDSLTLFSLLSLLKQFKN